eukprot:8427830-Pyramimonas_sp.AAC.1
MAPRRKSKQGQVDWAGILNTSTPRPVEGKLTPTSGVANPSEFQRHGVWSQPRGPLEHRAPTCTEWVRPVGGRGFQLYGYF